MKYYERMKNARTYKGVTQKQIAEKLSITQSCYCRYERGERVMPLDKLVMFCRATKISSNYILGLTSDLNYPQK